MAQENNHSTGDGELLKKALTVPALAKVPDTTKPAPADDPSKPSDSNNSSSEKK